MEAWLGEFFFLTLQYCIGFCHISTWIHHRYTRVPHPEHSSLLPPCTIPLGHPSAPAPSIRYHASNLDWRILSITLLVCEIEQLCSSWNILWHCPSLGLKWKLTFSSLVATAQFSKFAGILSEALSLHHLLGFEIAQLKFHHLHYLCL